MSSNKDMQTVLGGREVELTFRDGNKETVLVREIRIRDMQKFLELQDSEAELIELYCEKEKGWADNLTIESHEAALAVGGEINFPLFERWLERKNQTVKRLTPTMKKAAELLAGSQTS